MSVNIIINIQSNEAGFLTAFEQGILNSLSGAVVGAPTVLINTTVKEPVVAPATLTKAEAKAAAKAALVTKADDSAPVAVAAADGEVTLADAVAQATELVKQGKAADVKAALATVGATRVSELKGAKIATFLEALNA